MGETNATGEMRAAMIGHDASSAIASSALPGKKQQGARYRLWRLVMEAAAGQVRATAPEPTQPHHHQH